MAFFLKEGGRFVVRKGNSGTEVLSRFGTELAAKAEVDRLHRRNNPSNAGRGRTAQRRFGAQIREARKPGATGTPRQESFARTSAAKSLLRSVARKEKR